MAEQNLFNFSDFLETQPQAMYQSFVTDPQNRMTSSMRRYYPNQFNQIHNEYLGQLARDMRQGNLPTGRFENYLSDIFTSGTDATPDWQHLLGQADFGSPLYSLTGYDRFRRESPYSRSGFGAGPSGQRMYAPSARWITY